MGVQGGYTNDGRPWAWVTAAGKLGLPYDEYAAHRHAGEFWCCAHHAWEPAMLAVTRGERPGRVCREAHAQTQRAYYRRMRGGGGGSR